MSNNWFTAQQLASANLPGLPGTKQGIINRAKSESWKARDRKARGGGQEYHLSNLPTKARDALVDSFLANRKSNEAALAKSADLVPIVSANLNDWQREAMQARAMILRWIEEKALYAGQTKVIDRLVALSKSSQLPEELIAAVPLANAKSGNRTGKPKLTLSRATIFNWFKLYREGGVEALAPKMPAEVDLSVPAWAPALMERYRKPSKPSLAAVMDELPDYLPDDAKMPSYDQARRFLAKLSAVTKSKGRMGPQAIKALQAYTSRDTSTLWPGAVFTADGHTFKAAIEHPIHGQPFSPEITTVLDVYSRYAVGWSIGLSEESIGVLEALSHAMISKDDSRKGCVPAIWYTDNGRGFKNKMMEERGLGFMDRWGITPKHSLPYNSQARGVIERFQKHWGTAARSLQSYRGRDMDKEATRVIKRISDKEIAKSGKAPFVLTWQEFKAFIQDRIDEYNHTPHRGLPRVRDPETMRNRHLTPHEAWEAWENQGGEVVQITQDEAQDLFRPYIRRMVKRCMVTLLNQDYFSHDLEPYHGEYVQVGYDIHDGRQVWIRDFEGRLLAIAEADANSRPYFDDGTLLEAVSYRERKHEQRIKGRLARVEKKREEIEAEALPGQPLQIEHQETIPFTIEDQEAADREFVRLEEMTNPMEAIQAVPSTDRPTFSNELAWAVWLSENTEQATEKDRNQLASALRQPGFRDFLELEGVEISALEQIAA